MNPNPAQTVARLVGIVLVAFGVLGFVPGVTVHSSDLSFAGHGSGAMLVGQFQVSTLLNLVEIVLGAAGVALANGPGGARSYLAGGGVAFLALWALGMANGAAWIPLNVADRWLDLGLGVSLIALAFATREPMPVAGA